MAIHKASLVHFQPKCKEHQEALKNSKYFEIFSNTDLFLQMLEDTDFDSVAVEKNDFKKFIVEDKLFMGIDIIDNIEFDEHHYLFDAFNVYYAVNGFGYYKLNKTLTKVWRKTLINDYPNSTFHAEVKKM